MSLEDLCESVSFLPCVLFSLLPQLHELLLFPTVSLGLLSLLLRGGCYQLVGLPASLMSQTP